MAVSANSSFETEPHYQFKGMFIRPELFDLLGEGKINCGEFVLAVYIESLADPKGRCWANNTHLSVIMGVNPRQISRMIRNMKLAGVIATRFNSNNKRSLKIKYS